MKKITMLLLLLLPLVSLFACPVCERNKASYLRGITHGTGPDSKWDLVIVAAIALLALYTLFFSVKWLIRPNEGNPDHIKYSIFNEQ